MKIVLRDAMNHTAPEIRTQGVTIIRILAETPTIGGGVAVAGGDVADEEVIEAETLTGTIRVGIKITTIMTTKIMTTKIILLATILDTIMIDETFEEIRTTGLI